MFKGCDQRISCIETEFAWFELPTSAIGEHKHAFLLSYPEMGQKVSRRVVELVISQISKWSQTLFDKSH